MYDNYFEPKIISDFLKLLLWCRDIIRLLLITQEKEVHESRVCIFFEELLYQK